MKHLKKIVSLLLATIMVFGLTATALASNGGSDPAEPPAPVTPTYNDMQGSGTGLTGGSIIVTNSVKDVNYNIYQIMYLASSGTSEAPNYVYKAHTDWETFLSSSDAQTYVTVSGDAGNITVTWNAGITEAQKAEFAGKALTYAKTEGNVITPNGTSTVDASTHSAEFPNLNLGCYLVDNTGMGVVCELSPSRPASPVHANQPFYDNMEGGSEANLINGSITINDAVVGHTYSTYQIMYVDSLDTAQGAFAYKANPDWVEFLKSEPASKYVSVSDLGYVTWLHTPDNTTDDEAAVIEIAEAALAYAKDNNITAVTAPKATGDPNTIPSTTTVTINGLYLGYYLIDSTVGTLLALNTNNDGTTTLWEKNSEPTNEKEVQEDNGNGWGSSNDAQVGDTVNFRSTITLPKGSERIVYHDKMSAGLDLVADSVKVFFINAEGNEEELKPTEIVGENTIVNFTVDASGNCNHGTEEAPDCCTFIVVFKQNYLDDLTADNTTLYIKYSATINSSAIIGGDGNTNTSQISYGHATDTQYTPVSTTTTYVWAFNLLKYGDGNKENKLSGAQFVLLDKANEADHKVAIFETKTQRGVTYNMIKEWKSVSTISVVGDEIQWPADSILTTDENGTVDTIGGLDSVDTYWLREIKAPNGYNQLVGDQEVHVAIPTEDTPTPPALTIEVNNNKGTVMPGTGGIGTTIFYVVGSILLVGAVVLLVTKKRMSASK